MKAAITVSGLGKRFRRRNANAPSTLKEFILRGGRGLKAEVFWGLREVSFHITPGRTVGIIGRNGAGKSTLLRLLGGVGRPDEGSVQTSGRIGALLDLGAGLNGELSGRENIFVGGVIAGMTRAEVEARLDDIIAFAELEAFIDSPLRTYSTGMQMRLAFAIAVHIDPQILLIDEVLAVGDLAFQRKCIDRIKQFKEQGCTILIVSHDSSQIRALCDEVVYLRQGRLLGHGPTEDLLRQFEASMEQRGHALTSADVPDVETEGGLLQINVNRFGSQELQITGVRLQAPDGAPVSTISGGESLVVAVTLRAKAPARSPRLSVSISQTDGMTVFDTTTQISGLDLPDISGAAQVRLLIERLDLKGGHYFVNVGVYEHEWEHTYDYHWHVYPITVNAPGTNHGVIYPPLQWSYRSEDELEEGSLNRSHIGVGATGE